MMDKLPKWADVVLVPLISLLLAAIDLGSGDCWRLAQSPVEALKVMVDGALGSAYGWGYTLYYATSFIFTGLAVTVAFHAGLFNIGGEGQAQLGGLGRGVGLSGAAVAALDGGAVGGNAWGGGVWGGLGGDPGVFAGQTRQSYRDHHDHVQLYRGGVDRLYAGRCAAPSGADGPGIGAVSRRQRALPMR